jgi:hypothetical protein
MDSEAKQVFRRRKEANEEVGAKEFITLPKSIYALSGLCLCIKFSP